MIRAKMPSEMSVPILFAIYCFEAGLFFSIVPWTPIWTLNPLLHDSIAVAMWADNPFVRGFVSGIGIVHILVGVRELVTAMRVRRQGAA